MKLSSASFADGGAIPPEYALGRLDAQAQFCWSANRNPQLAWSEVPAGTASLVLLCIDGDAPLATDAVNRPGCQLAERAPRGDFFHWSLVDIPCSMTAIAAGALADGVRLQGKPEPRISLDGYWLRQGCNDYSGSFAADPALVGDYYGYDGPCPPLNDERVHHYIFRLYALDCARLTLAPRFTCADVLNAIHGHVMDEAQWIGTYTLNPALSPSLTAPPSHPTIA